MDVSAIAQKFSKYEIYILKNHVALIDLGESQYSLSQNEYAF